MNGRASGATGTTGSMRGGKAKTVDAYLAPLPEDIREALQRLRETIKEAAPMAEETISYGMPGYKYKGFLVFFGAFKDHCSFFPASRSIAKKFSKELNGLDVSGTTIHFTPGDPLPASLVKKIVKARIKENEEIAAHRKRK